MNRRAFLGILGLLAAGGWLGLKGLPWARADKPLKEAMYYKRLGGGQ